MGYAGIVSREHSSGERIRRGAISKAGNAHLRRIVVEAAWSYRHRPAIGSTLAARQKNASAAVTALAWKAQHRLHARYVRLIARGKSKQQTVTAVGRELLGFIWAIGIDDRACRRQRSRGLSTGDSRTMSQTSSASGQRPWWTTVKENPRHDLCGSLRARSATLVARQLPTNHDHDGEYSHSIHEYQSDQPSRIAATAAAHWRSIIRKTTRQQTRRVTLTGRSISDREAVSVSEATAFDRSGHPRRRKIGHNQVVEAGSKISNAVGRLSGSADCASASR